jgi:hypothetical protein
MLWCGTRPFKCSKASSPASKAACTSLLLFGLLLPYAVATPQQYVSRVATTDCTRHPDKAYGRHGKPVPDVRSSFTFVRLPDDISPGDARNDRVQASQGSSSGTSQQRITVMAADASQQASSPTAAAGLSADASGGRSSPLALCAGYTYALDVDFGGGLVNALVSSSTGRLTTDQRPAALEAVNAAAQALGLLNLYSREW